MLETIDRPFIASFLSRFRWFWRKHKGLWKLIEIETLGGTMQRWVNHVWETTKEEKLGKVITKEFYKYDWDILNDRLKDE